MKKKLSTRKKLTIFLLIFLFVFQNLSLVFAAEEVKNLKNQTKNKIDNNVDLQKVEQEIDSSESIMSTRSVGDIDYVYGDSRKPIKSKINFRTNEVNGSFIYNYPISIPSGRNALQPDFNLTYNSQNQKKDGIFGVGWSLNIPAIERINKTGVDSMYDNDDYFYSSLSGELSRKLSSSSEEILALRSFSEKIILTEREILLSSNKAYINNSGQTLLYEAKEEKDEKTRNSKTYFKGWDKNGKKIKQTKFYSGDLNYYDQKTQKFEEIDTRLTEALSEWQMNKANYKVKLKKETIDKFIAFQNQDQEIYFSLNNNKKIKGIKNFYNKDWANKEVLYKDAVSKGIDVSVKLDNEFLRKDFVINDLKYIDVSKNYFEIPFYIFSNKDIDVLVDGKSLKKERLIVSSSSAEIIDNYGIGSYIWKPIAVDNNESISNIDIKYELVNDKILVTKMISAEWLKNASYPVNTDLTISCYSVNGDGHIKKGGSYIWSDIRNASIGNSIDYIYNLISSGSDYNGRDYEVGRAFLPFDTSSLPDTANISSSTLKIYKVQTLNADNDGKDFIVVVSTNQSSVNSLSFSDYNKIGSVEGSDRIDIGDITGAYNDFVLNSTGISWIDRTGYTKIGLREGHDLLNEAPNISGNNLFLGYSKEQSGINKDPYLEITYTSNEAPSAPSNLKIENFSNPSGITNARPKFKAQYNDIDIDDIGIYYQIQVTATSSDWVNVMWDSAKQSFINPVGQSSTTEEIMYAASSSLAIDGEKYYWRMRIWDNADIAGAWSSGSDYFEMDNAPDASSNLLVNNKKNHKRLNTNHLLFSAQFNDLEQNDYAISYQIQVTATSGEWSILNWDSGKIDLISTTTQGSQSEELTYNGSLLPFDGKTYYWRIKFWDSDNNEGAWSSGSDYFQMGNIFTAKVEKGDFLHHELIDSDYWIVYDKSGKFYKFGSSSDARIENGDSSKKYKWYIEEIRDRNDNFIKYEYFKDNGKVYPDKITYTGHEDTDGIFEILFIRESKPDEITNYLSGDLVTTKYRIKEIQIKENGDLIKKYLISYTTGDNGNNSLISSIQQIGYDELSQSVSLPADNFTYQEKQEAWATDSNYSIPYYITYYDSGNRDNGVRIIDVNGDGLDDFIIGMRAYLNKSDGTGWSLTNYWNLPVGFTDNGKDTGARLADVNGDSLVDILYSGYHRCDQGEPDGNVYLNNGNGWTLKNDLSIPVFFSCSYEDDGARLADINGDGLIDIIKSIYFDQQYNPYGEKKVFINKGVDVGWVEDSNWEIPVYFAYEEPEYNEMYRDTGARFADVNGDGLADIVYATKIYNDMRTYLNKGDGTGWVSSGVWKPPFTFIGSFRNDIGARIVDVNGDGLVDIVKFDDHGGDVYLNTGEGWISNNDWYLPPEEFTGVIFANMDGDGLIDIVESREYSSYTFTKKIYIASSSAPDLLTKIETSKGSVSKINYKGTAEFLDENNDLSNPDLSFIMQIVDSITLDDGFGNYATTSYEYFGGEYFFEDNFNKRFAGFEKVKKIDPLENVTIDYYHQGNTSTSSIGEYLDHKSKIGLIYRTEVYDDSDNLYSKNIKKWENYAIDDEHDFVKLTRDVSFSYDGDNDHRDIANSFVYNNENGNKIQEISWGEVIGADDGNFSDIGIDRASTTIEYAASSSIYLFGLPNRQITEDQNGNKVKETKYYYDNLSLGNVDKGNNTKIEQWLENNDYIDIEKSYNEYGLVTQEKDPRDKISNYIYDSYNLYVATSTNALSQSQEFYYDYSSGQIKKTIDANGNKFEVVYDGLDRPIEEKQPDIDNPSTLVTKTIYTYDDTSTVRSVKKSNYLDVANVVDSYVYLDGLDRPIQERQEAESSYIAKDYQYNKLGNIEKKSLPYFSNGIASTIATSTKTLYTNYKYDALGRVISIVNAVGTTTNAYDDWKVTTTDAKGNLKDLYNDARGNLIQVDEHNGENIYTTEYEYDLLGNLTRIEDSMDNEREFDYDALSKIKASEDLHSASDLNYGTINYSYDDAGNLTSKTDAKNQTVNYTYDDLNRVLSEDYTGEAGVEVDYLYDDCENGVGQLCIATSSGAIVNYDYNILGQVKEENKIIDSNTYSTGYEYDRQGNLTQITYPDNTEVKYAFNNGGVIEGVEKKENGEASFVSVVNDMDYNAMGQLTYEDYNNGVYTNNSYDPNKLYRLNNKKTITLNTEEDEFDTMNMLLSVTNEDNIVSQILSEEVRNFYNKKSKEIKKQNIKSKSKVSEKAIDNFIEAKEKEKGLLKSKSVSDDFKMMLLSSNLAPRESDNMYSENLWHTETITYNESFEDGLTAWDNYSPNGAIFTTDCNTSFSGDCSAKISVATTTPYWWDAMFYQEVRAENLKYKVKFKAKASTNTIMTVSFYENHDPWYRLEFEKEINIGTEWEEYEYYFTCPNFDEEARVLFGFGKQEADYWIDDVELVPNILNLVNNHSFDEEPEWPQWFFWNYDSGAEGEYDIICSDSNDGDCSAHIDMTVGGDYWQSQLFQLLAVDSNETYILTFDAKSNSNRTIYPAIVQNHDPWIDLTVLAGVDITNEWKNYKIELDPSQSDTNARLMYYLGNDVNDVYLDNIHIWEKQDLKVSDPTPEFSSIYDDPDVDDISNYYQIQVTKEGNTFDNSVWDSGKTSLSPTVSEGNRTIDISYGGNNLPLDGSKYYWRIKLWDDENAEGAWTNGRDYFIMEGKKIQDLSYEYDEVGNITKIIDESDTNSAKELDFEYDDLYRLVRASSTDAVNSQDYLRTYGYNSVGNILNKSDQGNYGYVDNGYNNPHAVTSVNGTNYVYDNNGNLTGDNDWSHSWDYMDRLTQSVDGSKTIQYAYDNGKNRVSYFDGDVTTYYPNKLYNVTSTGTSTKHIFAGSNLIGTIENNDGFRYIHEDHLGGSSVVTDESGEVEQLIDYYPFGDVRLNEKSEEFDEQRKFTGHEYDEDTSLSYMIARYQDGKTGRFISADPRIRDLRLTVEDLINPQRQNYYSYVYNNPLKYVDPNGEVGVLLAILGAVTYGVFFDDINAAISPSTQQDLSQHNESKNGFQYFGDHYNVGSNWQLGIGVVGGVVQFKNNPVKSFKNLRGTYRQLRGVLNSAKQVGQQIDVTNPQVHHVLPQYLGKMLGYTKNDMMDHPGIVVSQFDHTGKLNKNALHKAISSHLPTYQNGQKMNYTQDQIYEGLQNAYNDIGQGDLFNDVKDLIKSKD